MKSRDRWGETLVPPFPGPFYTGVMRMMVDNHPHAFLALFEEVGGCVNVYEAVVVHGPIEGDKKVTRGPFKAQITANDWHMLLELGQLDHRLGEMMLTKGWNWELQRIIAFLF